jgi:hypothetical protein
MSARVTSVIVAATVACAGSQRAPLPKAGDERDDGAGELARAALGFQTPEDDAPGFVDQRARRVYEAGLVQIEVKAGVTKIESEDGKLASAWVLGLDTLYYAITDDLGRFRIDELAPGTYELTFWQPPVASISRDGTFSYGPPIVAKRTVKVGATTARLSVTLPSR